MMFKVKKVSKVYTSQNFICCWCCRCVVGIVGIVGIDGIVNIVDLVGHVGTLVVGVSRQTFNF